MADGVSKDELYPLDLDRAFAKLDTIKDSIIWWSKGAEPSQMLSTGEADYALAWSGRIATAKDEGSPVDMTYDGGIMITAGWVVPKNAPNRENAMKFIEYASEANQQYEWATVIIPLAFILLTLVVSSIGIIKKSFTGADGFTLDYYIKIFTEPLYLKVLLNTLLTGVIVTVACLLLAYPAAYLSVRAKKPIVRRLITGRIMIPYWMSMLVRIFAWQIILQS